MSEKKYNMSNYILEAKNISKTYGRNLVLEDISFVCQNGEAIAFVGVNGCGKSTLLRILSGATSPTSGEIIYGQANPSVDLTLTFLPDHYEKTNTKVRVFFKQVMDIYQCLDYQDRLNELVHIFNLESMMDIPLKYLSKGSLQKIAIIQALLCESDLLFMDEPLSGQDMLSKMNFVDQIHKIRKKGTSIIMACHDSDLIEDIADIVWRIEKGKLIADSTSNYPSLSSGKYGIFLVNIPNQNDYDLIEKLDFVYSSTRMDGKCKILTNAINSQKLFAYCVEKDIRILRYEEGEPS